MYCVPKNNAMLSTMNADREKNPGTFGKRFRAARQVDDLSQDDVVKQLGARGIKLTQSGLSHYETGRTFPDPATMVAMADVVGVSLDYLLGRTKTKSPVSELEETLAAATGKGKINKVMERLNRENQQRVISYAEFLLSEEKKTAKPDELGEWIASTEVLARRLGASGERSFAQLLSSSRPDLAAALGILAKKEPA